MSLAVSVALKQCSISNFIGIWSMSTNDNNTHSINTHNGTGLRKNLYGHFALGTSSTSTKNIVYIKQCAL